MPESALNPLLEPWDGPFDTPHFSRFRPEHYRPAFDAALAERRAEIDAIKTNAAPADFDNTLAALERAGETLARVEAVFFHLSSADSNDELDAIERDIAPVLAREASAIFLDDALFTRIEAVHARADELAPQARRAAERYHLIFARAGAGLEAGRKARLAEINERLAALGAQFGQNVLADERGYWLALEGEDDLAGLSASFIAAAAQAARERGLEGRKIVTLSRSSAEPFLSTSARRDLREKVWKAFVARGGGGAHDNGAIIAETLKLRAEKAALFDSPTYADHRLADTMAKTPDNALDLLNRVWAPARARALEEAAALSEEIRLSGESHALAPWDWRYYAEKRRQRLYDFDETQLKDYLPLDSVIEASFAVAGRLFGLSFAPRLDIDLPHADARAYDVRNAGGEIIGLFIGDYFARTSKRSGAWMDGLRVQQRLAGDRKPIVLNTMSFARACDGACLLSYDEAHTLFHEFGHGLHGLLSDVTYPLLSGTAVARDFVELPSQLYEHWIDRPEVLTRFARHHASGEPMPKRLLDGVLAARRYGQGFATVEFLASAFFDMAAHRLAPAATFDATKIEAETLAALGMPAQIAPRHGAAHFQHIFAGDGYSAGYYSYMWSEVLDADAFEAFVEAGDPFDPDLALKLKTHIYAAGNKQPPEDAYLAFRGRPPRVEALLRKRGFV